MKHCLHFLLLLCTLATARARDNDAEAALARFKSGTHDLRTLVEVVPLLADPALREMIRSKLIETENPPHKELVALLDHPLLAVRLGALEILEETAGGDLSYNPWTPAHSPENEAALARWGAWADDPVLPSNKVGLFSAEQRQGYLQDILGNNADKATRARRMLEAEGLGAVGFLETFLEETSTLSAGHRARIREAQYQITLSRQLGDQAAVTARHLAFGSRDQILSALTTVRSAGHLALPILRDFISHRDPLIRENAIDSLLVTGGKPAVAIIAPLLKQESDVNVIHGALRRIKDVPGTASAELVTSFLDSSDEDLLISAIQTSLSLASNTSDNSYSSSSSKSKSFPADPAVIALLSDPRWRIRATALEYIAKRRLPDAKDACISLLEDSDEFVRFAAIKAISALEAKDALPKLKALFMKDESMAGPVIGGYGALNQKPDLEMLTRLDTASPEARISAIRAIESNDGLANIALRYANDENIDVACAALRQIASDSDGIKNNTNASVIVTALRSGVPAKVEAVLERLELPKSERIDPAVMQALNAGLAHSEPTALDPLYDLFLKVGINTTNKPDLPVMPEAQATLINEFVSRTTPETSPGDRFRAALALAKASHPEGFLALLRDLPSLTTAQKTAIADDLYEPSIREALPLLQQLLRDPLPEIRTAAAAAALSNDDAPAFSRLVFEELLDPTALLQAHEVYNYRFESVARSGSLTRLVKNWCGTVLDSPDTATPIKVLASIGLLNHSSTAAAAKLTELTNSQDPLLRRAAWHALLTIHPTSIHKSAARIIADPEASVRVVFPLALSAADPFWKHHFSNLHIINDSRWSSSNSKPRLNEALRTQLSKLASQDPSDRVRFEAAFALLTQRGTVDTDELVTLVPKVPEEANARRRLTTWLGENAKRATPGLHPLLAIIDPTAIKPQIMEVLKKRINPVKAEGFATFASLAKNSAPDPGTDSLLTAPEEIKAPAERKSLEIVYFYKPGCAECAHVKQYINAISEDFPLLQLREHNMMQAAGTLLNQALCERFRVPSAKHSLSPSIFCQAGFLIGDQITPRSLAGLLTKTMGTSQDDAWMKIDRASQEAAGKTVDRRYAAFTLPIVIGAGLLDGINPCAFATIIFFLSYLQIARRTPREMLMVGAAFITAVFIAYLAAGLVLYQSLAALNEHFSGIQKWMNFGFAALALIAAFLSFRDAWRARGGRLDGMTLQLPAVFKNRIRSVIRVGSRARNFVIAAFISGLLVSLLELACTGQVYAPIIYQIQQGRLDAVLWLVIYNLAFISPLIVIFLLAYGGLRSESLITFQKNHTTAVKFSLGLLFVILALFILIGRQWLAPH